jgi:hypothetical protein
MYAIAIVLLNTLSFASLAYVANRKGYHTMAALLAAGAWLFGVTGGMLIWGSGADVSPLPAAVVRRGDAGLLHHPRPQRATRSRTSRIAKLLKLLCKQKASHLPGHQLQFAVKLRGGAMKITASTLYDLVQCPQRVALDAFGDPAERDEINPFVRLLWERGTVFERDTIGKLQLPFTDLSKVDEADRERLTLEAMRRGDPLIYGGFISAENLFGMPDLLRKEIGGYVPGDIKSGRGKDGGDDDHDGKPKLHYAVQLALYADILERLNLSAGRRAFVWDIQGDEVGYDFTALSGQNLWRNMRARSPKRVRFTRDS